MADYIPPDPAVAAWVYQQQLASEQRHRRLRNSSPEQLKQLARDASEPAIVRIAALARLVHMPWENPPVPADQEAPDVLLGLLAEPDPALRRGAVQCSRYLWSDSRIAEGVRRLLDDSDRNVQAAAAAALAEGRDGTIVPHLLAWFHGEEQPLRNLATECLRRVNSPETRHVLREAWEQGGRGDEDRVGLAMALLRVGDPCGVPFLEQVSRWAAGAWSGVAATALFIAPTHQAQGLRLMRLILDCGDLEAKRWMVNQISNLSPPGLLHAWTADGIHEARCWIDQQLQAARDSQTG
jgi:hypothetical protein